jgi:3-oxoacyl-[acyl-carrier-protein] synthase-3
MSFCVQDIAYELGEIKISTKDLIAKMVIPESKKIELAERVGTEYIYETVAESDFFSLSTKCINSLLLANPINTENLGIIFVSQSNSQIIPAEGQRIRHACNLPSSVFVLDLNIGCSGFVYALFLADSLLKTSQLKNIIIVAGDTYRRSLNKDDRSTKLLFSDAVSAVLITSGGTTEILQVDFGGDGLNYKDISLPVIQDYSEKTFFRMEGAKVFSFTNSVIPTSINNVLLTSSTKISEVSLVFFHQASGIVLQTLQSKLGLSETQIPKTINTFGNTGSASIPITISSCLTRKEINTGDTIILSGFGVGLSYGTILLKW